MGNRRILNATGLDYRVAVTALVLALFAGILGGCATGLDELRSEIRTFRQEQRAELQDQRETLDARLAALRKESAAARETLASDIRAEFAETLARIEQVYAQRSAEWDLRIAEIADRTETTAKNCDMSIMEMRKELFHSKRTVDEQSRRLFRLESSVETEAESEAPHGETFVTFIEGNLVSVALGRGAGISEGATIDIYKKGAEGKKIASAKITSVDIDTASGEIFYRVDSVNTGDRVKRSEQ